MSHRVAFLCCLIPLMAVAWSVDVFGRQAQRESAVFFSQGQAVYNPQAPAKSKDDAVQDFLAQAVTQAVARYLNPAEMGNKFAPLQEKILKQPKRYVETYQLFAEGPSGGLYRVRGQATISMEALKQDLTGSGFALAEQLRSDSRAALPSESEKSSVAVGEQSREQPRTTSRGMSIAKQEIFWVVAEKWEEGWSIPYDRSDMQSTFAMSVIQETSGYGWSLRFPSRGGIEASPDGSIPVGDVLSLAKKLGVPKAITGSVTIGQTRDQKQSLDVSLKILDVYSGKPEGEIHKELPLNGTSHQEGAMDLAGIVAPQLDRLLREPIRSEPSQEVASIERSQPVESVGEWTVTVKGANPYASWDEVARALEAQFKSMKVLKLEVGVDAVNVRLDGVDGGFLNSLQEKVLDGGSKVQVIGFSQESRSISLTLSRP